MNLKLNLKIRSNKKIITFIFVLLILLVISLYVYTNYIKFYTNIDFGIQDLKSDIDFNNNGIDDYTDILLGARLEVKKHPKYKSEYYQNAYPPDGVGVCTDIIWRAFKNAGYSLRDMINEDIELNPKEYNIKNPDKNIDFRRVKNLKIFFERYAIKLTKNPNEISQWQAGDIVICNDNHIAIISNKRNKKGQAYIIHHYSSYQLSLEENTLSRHVITGHYRFDASIIDKNILKKWA